MRIGVLGPLEVRVGPRSRALGSEKQRLLLAALTVQAGSVVSTDRLVEILWGEEPPPSALRSLRTYIYRLRAALEDRERDRELIVTRPPGYLLDPAAVEMIDAWRHETLLKASSDPERAASSRLPLLDEALALWRGPAYAEFCDEEFARGEALRLDESRRVAADARCAALIDLGQHADAIADLDAIVDRHPHRERPRELLMRALYRSGRHADALDVCNDLRNRLREELGLDLPPAIATLEVDILRQAPELAAPGPAPAAAPANAHRPNLPAETTRLIGRDAQLRSLTEALDDASIASVVGPGGVGKTRMALAASRAWEERGPGAVWWCELAPVQEQRDVAHVVASALQVRPDERLSVAGAVVEHLRHRSGLLVLDNCEHLSAEVASLVRRIATECPDLTVLLTSRSVLGLEGEHIHRLAPLSLGLAAPDAQPAAVELLLDRLQGTRPDLVADHGEHRHLAELCRRLDGLPLAIELAASRLRSLNPADLLARLDDRLDLVASTTGTGARDRHRTLRGVLEWSFELLSRTERLLFARLSVFAGSFTLDAAEQVVSGAGIGRDEVVDLLSRLVDHSLVTILPGGGRVRYTLLETLRVHGGEVLDQRGETDRWRHRHATYYVELAEVAEVDLRGPAEATATAQLDAELDNLRSAHHWAVTHDLDLSMRLSAALFRYALWRLRAEVFAWAGNAARCDGAADHRLFPVVAGMVAWGAGLGGARDASLEWSERGLAALEREDDPRGLAPLEARMHAALWEGRLDDCLADAELAQPLCTHPYELVPYYVPGLALTYAGRPTEALRHLEEVEQRAEAHRNPTMCSLVSYTKGEALLELDPVGAQEPLRRAAELADSVDNHVVGGVADVSLISIQARLGGGGPEAIASFGAVIDRLHGAGDWTHLWTGLRGLVGMLVAQGHQEDAARLTGALRAADNAPPLYGEDAQRLAEAEDHLAAALGPQRWEHLVAEGARMTDDEAIAFARQAIARGSTAEDQAATPRWRR